MRTVTFDKSKGSLGLRLKSDDETPGVCVLEKVAGGQGATEANIRVGDFIHKVNGQDVTGLQHDAVVQAIVDAQGEVALTVSATPPAAAPVPAVVEEPMASSAAQPQDAATSGKYAFDRRTLNFSRKVNPKSSNAPDIRSHSDV